MIMKCDICGKKKQVLFKMILYEQQCTPELWSGPKTICEECLTKAGLDTQSLIDIISLNK